MKLIKEIMNTFNDDRLFEGCYKFNFRVINKELKIIILLDKKDNEICKIEMRITNNSCKLICQGFVSFVLNNNISYDIIKEMFKRSPICINPILHKKISMCNSAKDLIKI